MKSKICISILIVMIMITSITISNFKSSAATSTEANIVVESKNIEGNEVTVNINLQNDVDFVAGNFTFTYDDTVLEYVSYIEGSSLKNSDGTTNGTLLLNTETSGQIKIGYMSDVEQNSETKKAGQLMALTFNVNSEAVGTTNLELECTTLKKSDGINVTANITNGTLEVIASSLQMNNSNLSLNVGESSTLTVYTSPTSIDLSNKEIIWQSDNEEIATVDSNGVVTAVGAGDTIIRATVLGLSAECYVTVTSPLESISLDCTNITLPKHQIKQLTVIYNPEDTTDDRIVTWNSSNESVATVDEYGVVTAYQDGTAIITATVGDKTATCTITVSGELGDLDGDENITAYDAYKALEVSLDIEGEIEVDEQTILTSDVDKDEEVTAQDAFIILEYSVGLISEF